MVKAVVENSAAGFAHPDDPSLRIQQVAIVSSTGIPDTFEGPHAYGYTNGLLTTDTWTSPAGVYVKTYTYNAAGQLIGESDWVKQ